MRQADIHTGATYLATISGREVSVRITAERAQGGWFGRNLSTGREITIRSARRLRPQRISTRLQARLSVSCRGISRCVARHLSLQVALIDAMRLDLRRAGAEVR